MHEISGKTHFEGRETEGDRDAPWPICIADDEANDDLRDDNEDKEARLEESNGVDSDAGGSPLLVLASRLQTGQNVLHDEFAIGVLLCL
uniref:Uncharacterized protein n=1 Tax=Solanum lycopersicum TaxID=4081 RepID=A0A3Q7ITI5_SOLLC